MKATSAGVSCDELYLEGGSFQLLPMNVVCSDGWRPIQQDYRCEPEKKSTKTFGTASLAAGKIISVETDYFKSPGTSMLQLCGKGENKPYRYWHA